MLATLEVSYTPGVLVAVAYCSGVEVGRTSISSAIGEAFIAASADRSELSAELDDLAFISIELHDTEDTLITGADRPVNIDVSGAGVLAGMCSANPKTVERFDFSTWTTFDSRALAVIRQTGTGDITATVTGDDVAPVAIHLHAGSRPSADRTARWE